MCDTDNSTEAHHEPGQYEIRLKGHLDQRWAARFDGLTLSHTSDGTTILLGPVVDQAALHGVLRKIRDLGLPLLSVREIGPGQANEPDTTSDSDHENRETHT
jgi:hypothetical protein